MHPFKAIKLISLHSFDPKRQSNVSHIYVDIWYPLSLIPVAVDPFAIEIQVKQNVLLKDSAQEYMYIQNPLLIQ
jgi:hypothetical protein